MSEDAICASVNRKRPGVVRRVAQLFWLTVCSVLVFYIFLGTEVERSNHVLSAHVQRTIEQCKAKDRPAGPPPDFHDRDTSDRFQPGTPPVLIRNARIWTGANNGTEKVTGDILLKDGLVAAIVTLGSDSLARSKKDPTILASMQDSQLEIIDAKGRWITPGYIENLSS